METKHEKGKSIVVGVRFSEPEIQKLEVYSRMIGISRASFVRMCALKRLLQEKELLKEISA